MLVRDVRLNPITSGSRPLFNFAHSPGFKSRVFRTNARALRASPCKSGAHHVRSQTAADRQKGQDVDAIGELAKAVLDRYHDRGEDQAADDGFEKHGPPPRIWAGNVGAIAPI
jgi:hypothetical protein